MTRMRSVFGRIAWETEPEHLTEFDVRTALFLYCAQLDPSVQYKLSDPISFEARSQQYSG